MTSGTGSAPASIAVSVIVPVYNAERYLDQALTSAEGQSLSELEIICVNDGSTDRSADIMRAHAERDGRIRIIEQDNGGYGSAMNRGLDAARGEWVAILEPDDWIEPHMLADMTALAADYAQHPVPVDIVKTPYWVIRNPDTPAEAKLHCSYRGRIRPKAQPFTVHDAPHLLLHHPSIWSAIYRRAFLDGYGIRFREVPGAGWADNPFLVETLCQARGILYLPHPYYCYREETPEKTAAMAERSPLVPLERWEDMMDVLEHLDVTDEVVLSAQTLRGFTYIGIAGVHADLETCRPEVRAAVERMFARMDPKLVLAHPRISPAHKRLFATWRGIEQPRINEFDHIRSLASEAAYNAWNKGPVQTLKMAQGYLSRAAGQYDRRAQID